MRIDHPTTPFDAEFEDDLELTQQFWGATRDWQPTSELEPTERRTTAVDAVRERLAAYRPHHRDTGSLARTRRHGVVTATPPADEREATLGELASGITNHDLAVGRTLDGATRGDATWDEWSQIQVADDPFATNRTSAARRRSLEPGAEIPLSGLADRLGVGAVDPRLVRLGLVALVAVLLVPLALALRPSEADSVRTVLPTPTPAVAPGTPTGPEPSGDTGPAPATGATQPSAVTPDAPEQAAGEGTAVPTASPASSAVASPAPAAPDAPAGDDAVAATEATDGAVVGDVSQDTDPEATASAAAGIDDAATASAPAERLAPECPQAYTAGTGDSWYRIADAAGVSPAELVELNLATFETPIFPGDEICLPAGATIPSPPTTAPATTAPETTAPATTAPPTTSPATTSPASPGEVEQIIRDVWPDELEERALEIAWVESRYDPNAYNGWCCYGVFQIYWSVHQGWLDDYGIFEVNDLYDPRKNTEAAYALYRSAGGWGPWGG